MRPSKRIPDLRVRSNMHFGWFKQFCFALVALLLLSVTAAHADTTAAGVWEQVNEKGEPQSTITISVSGGVYVGRITALLPKPGRPDNPLCDKCSGSQKGQPIKGLQIINGMKQSGLDYSDGTILDPESGTLYSAIMQLSSDNRHLTVRGYVGISAFGRSQTWNRIK